MNAKDMTLTKAKLREWMNYDPETGIFTRLKGGKRSDRIGAVAGCPQHQGYLEIPVDSVKYKAHRLAWLYVYGVWPVGIDHINHDKSDNRIANLREATKAQNEMNKPRRASNSSGVTGVYWNKGAKKWQAYLVAGGQSHYLGIHESLDDAAAARKASERVHFGEYAYGAEA